MHVSVHLYTTEMEHYQAKPGDMSHPAESDYSLDIDDVHIPSHAIRGRVNLPGQFSAYIDASTGVMRIDHSRDHAFWLQIDMSMLMDAYLAMKFIPGGAEANAAVERATEASTK